MGYVIVSKVGLVLENFVLVINDGVWSGLFR